MLIVVHIPLYDIRKFTPNSWAVLNKPSWFDLSFSDVNTQFVRSTGPINRRLTGYNFEGENFYVSAKNAIKFRSLPEISIVDTDGHIDVQKVKPKFRRFMHDGLCCAKLEIGFAINLSSNFTIEGDSIVDFIKSVQNCDVSVSMYREANIECKLYRCNKYIATHFERATTMHSRLDQLSSNIGIYPGDTEIVIERNEEEKNNMYLIRYSTLKSHYIKGIKLGFGTVNNQETVTKVWDIQGGQETSRRTYRWLRLAILNRCLETGAFIKVLRLVKDNRIAPGRNKFPDESNSLNYFFQRFVRRYFYYNYGYESLGKVNGQLLGNEISAIIVDYFDTLNEGEMIDLEDKLQFVIDLRPNVLNNVKKYIKYQQNMKKRNKTITNNITGNKGKITIVNGGELNNNHIVLNGEFDLAFKKLYSQFQFEQREYFDNLQKLIVLEEFENYEKEKKNSTKVEVLDQLVKELKKAIYQANSSEAKKKHKELKDKTKKWSDLGLPIIDIITSIINLSSAILG